MTSSIYVIGVVGSKTVKIGRTVNLRARLAHIQNMCPVPLRILFVSPGGPSCEMALHARFAELRSHGEWFVFDEDPVEAVKEALLDFPAETYKDASQANSSTTFRMPALTDYVTFEDAARALRKTGLEPNATGDTVRYTARTSPKWPIGEGRPHAYGKAGNSRTVQLGPVLDFYRENPRPGARGPDKKPRARRAGRP